MVVPSAEPGTAAVNMRRWKLGPGRYLPDWEKLGSLPTPKFLLFTSRPSCHTCCVQGRQDGSVGLISEFHSSQCWLRCCMISRTTRAFASVLAHSFLQNFPSLKVRHLSTSEDYSSLTSSCSRSAQVSWESLIKAKN